MHHQLTTLGWLEWVSLPRLGVPLLRAKIDSGAKTSCLHAEQIEAFDSEAGRRVRFVVRTKRGEWPVECPILDERHVKSSSGHEELRLVIESLCVIGKVRWPIELTLTDRASMRYPMLLGRRAMEARFLVDPSQKSLQGKPHRKRTT